MKLDQLISTQHLQVLMWTEESMDAANFIAVLRNDHSHPNFQQLQPWSVNSHQHWGEALHQEKDYYNLLKTLMMVIIFFKQ